MRYWYDPSVVVPVTVPDGTTPLEFWRYGDRLVDAGLGHVERLAPRPVVGGAGLVVERHVHRGGHEQRRDHAQHDRRDERDARLVTAAEESVHDDVPCEGGGAVAEVDLRIAA